MRFCGERDIMKSWFTSIAVMSVVFIAASVSADPTTADPVLDAASGTITNLQTVVPGALYRGAHPGDAGIEALAKAGIRTVIDLQGDDTSADAGESQADRLEEQGIVEGNGMTFFNVPLSSMKFDFDDQAQKINTALDLISDPANQPVFFHCFHGEDRTGVLAALYRIVYQGCTIDQAHHEMIEDGHDPLLFWIDAFLDHDAKDFTALPGRSSACPLN
jgi:protein tyrosine/serine phosphatase